MTLTIRSANAAAQAALDRLAQLDSSALPTAPHLIAEADGRLVAAVASPSGEAIADPFLPTADVIALLQLRAAGARSRGRRTPTGRRSPARRGQRLGVHARTA
jgi:hypothetical protein